MRHRLVLIGWTGSRKAYLDMSLTEAITRYQQSDGPVEASTPTDEFEFDDEFYVYSAGPP